MTNNEDRKIVVYVSKEQYETFLYLLKKEAKLYHVNIKIIE